MPHIRDQDAALARATRSLVRNATASLTGRQRGPDRQVRRNSYDVDDDRAKPWARLGDGSVEQGIVYREAVLQTADELRHQQWRKHPLADMRALRAERDQLTAELIGLDAVPDIAPIGRRAVIRQRLAEIRPTIATFENRLRRIDLTVLKALLHHLDFRTGRMFPELQTIADVAGCHRNAAIAALRRLKAHGFVDWVRRSISTGRHHEFAPQREQTSSAYVCRPADQLKGPTRMRYLTLLTAKLRRLGKRPPGIGSPPSRPPREPSPVLAAALGALGAGVARAGT